MNDPDGSHAVCLELLGTHPQHGEARRRGAKVRHPGTHQIEHLAVNPELFVESANRSNGVVINVGDQPRPGVKGLIA